MFPFFLTQLENWKSGLDVYYFHAFSPLFLLEKIVFMSITFFHFSTQIRKMALMRVIPNILL